MLRRASLLALACAISAPAYANAPQSPAVAAALTPAAADAFVAEVEKNHAYM